MKKKGFALIALMVVITASAPTVEPTPLTVDVEVVEIPMLVPVTLVILGFSENRYDPVVLEEVEFLGCYFQE